MWKKDKQTDPLLERINSLQNKYLTSRDVTITCYQRVCLLRGDMFTAKGYV